MKNLPRIAFWSLGLIWGSNFIYMKLAAGLLTPTQVVTLRVLFGFLPVFIYALSQKAIKREHFRHVRHFVVMSLLATVVYYYGFVKGASLLPSGIAGVMSGAIPLFSFVLALIFLAQEKATTSKILGIALGFLGVLLIAHPFDGNFAGANLQGVAYMLIGSLSVGASFIYAKKYVLPLKIPASALTSYQLGMSLLILTVLTDFSGIGKIWSNSHVAAGLVLGLGLLGTGLAYIIYYYIIEKLGAVSAASVTYIPPIVALLIGAVIVGENIGWIDYVATALIFAGVILLNRGKS